MKYNFKQFKAHNRRTQYTGISVNEKNILTSRDITEKLRGVERVNVFYDTDNAVIAFEISEEGTNQLVNTKHNNCTIRVNARFDGEMPLGRYHYQGEEDGKMIFIHHGKL